MSEKKSLFEVIKENLVNGELPDDFSLPREEAGEGELQASVRLTKKRQSRCLETL